MIYTQTKREAKNAMEAIVETIRDYNSGKRNAAIYLPKMILTYENRFDEKVKVNFVRREIKSISFTYFGTKYEVEI